MARIILTILITICSLPIFSQTNDSMRFIQKHEKMLNWKRAIIVPSIFITAGVVASTDNEVFDKWEVREERNEFIPKFRTHADDYIQYAPIVAVYGLNAFGLKGKHDFANRTALLIKSELIMMAIVLPLKRITAVPRPDTGAPNSFPSGHTAEAFAAATFLHKEYGKDHPLVSVLGYGVATGVGVLRVMNNRHWISDVITSAGIGILATNIAYLTHQNKWGNRKSKLGTMTFLPSYSKGSYGAYIGLRLK